MSALELGLHFAAVFVASTLCVLSMWFYFNVWRRDLPPGPTPLPVIGNLHQLVWGGSDNMQTMLMTWGRRYGGMFTMYIGNKPSVVLNTYDVIKEAFTSKMFVGRPHTYVFDHLSTYGTFAFAEGSPWTQRRRMAMIPFKDHCKQGRVSFEWKVLAGIKRFLEILDEHHGETYNIQPMMSHSLANVMSSVLWGKSYEHADADFQDVLESLKGISIDMSKASLMSDIFPFLPYLPVDVIGAKAIVRGSKRVQEFIQRILEEHKSTHDPNHVRDFVDFFLTQTDQQGTFTDWHVTGVLMDLFAAGIDTTSATLSWAILYLVRNPQIQLEAQSEVDEVIGVGRSPSFEDKKNMPYLQAVLTEVHRIGVVLSTALPHAPMGDVIFKGYHIPKGTTIIPNMAAVFLNEEKFPNPKSFNPRRFINDNGHFSTEAAKEIISFGVGRRACVGEPLARMTLFLYLTSMLQRFTFSTPDGTKAPRTDGIQGLAYRPRPYKLCAVSRG